MNEWILVAILPVELAIGLTIVGVLLNNVWMPIQRSFSQQEVLEPSFKRNYQSLSFGLINAGFCYHIAIDDAHLHITPVRPLRWIGQRSVSIPWSQIELHKSQPLGKRFVRVSINRREMVGPAWCFEMLKLPQ